MLLHEADCSPSNSEPVFVLFPDAQTEDDGKLQLLLGNDVLL